MNAALRPLLGDFTLDLYVGIVALEAERVSLTPWNLFGKEHLKGYRRWRWRFVQLLATSEKIDSFRVRPPDIDSVLLAHFFREQWVYTIQHFIGGRFRVHRNHTYYLLRITAPVELDEQPTYRTTSERVRTGDFGRLE
jgi:hypothetical protein